MSPHRHIALALSALLLLPALALSALLLLPTVAHAELEDELGLGAESAALAGAVSAVPVGFASAFTNPAMLAPPGAVPTTASLSLTLAAAAPILHVDGLDGGALPALAPCAADPASTPCAETPPVATAVLGATFDLGTIFGAPGRVMAGLALHTPLAYLFRYEVHPDDTVQWMMLTDRAQHLGLHGGVGIEVTDWLSIGLGVRLLINLQIYTTGLVSGVESTTDPVTGATTFEAATRLGEDASVFGRAAPTAGLAVHPIEQLNIGFTYRHELYVDDWGYARTTRTPGLGALGYIYRFAHWYQPHEMVLSAAYTPIPELRISVDLTLSLWSNATSKNSDPLPGRFGDTLTPALGVRYAPTPGVGILAGYRFAPRRFDNFGGPTNVLDTDEHTGSLGADVDLGAVTGDDIPVILRAAGRVSVLAEREEHKDFRRFETDALLLANPGYPGYRYGGVVVSGQLEVETRF